MPTPYAPPFRKIRAKVLIDGNEVPETPLREFTVRRSRFGRADGATVSLAINRNFISDPNRAITPPSNLPAGATMSLLWWDSYQWPPPRHKVDILMRDLKSEDAADWYPFFTCYVDRLTWFPVDQLLQLECRDALSLLLDQKIQAGWLNLTGPQLAEKVISAAGLTSDIYIEKPTMEGNFWSLEYKRRAAYHHAQFQSAYDVCRYIADSSGCDIFADGTTIIIRSPETDQGNDVQTLTCDLSSLKIIRSDAQNLSLTRDNVISNNLCVYVSSWDPRQRTRAEVWWDRNGAHTTEPDTKKSLYSYKVTGKKQEDIVSIAQSRYRALIQHSREIKATLPGRFDVEPRGRMALKGTGTSWDATYIIQSVESSYTSESLFTQRITLRNAAPPGTQEESDTSS